MLVKTPRKCGCLMLRQLHELAERLGEEQRAQRGPTEFSEKLILGHSHQGINADCNFSPYTRDRMESPSFSLFALSISVLGWCLKTPSRILPHRDEAARLSLGHT